MMSLVIPVRAGAVLLHRSLQMYAPSNILIQRVRLSRQTVGSVAPLVVLAAVLLVVLRAVSNAVTGGAPGWLNLVVLVLAWDAAKFGSLAVHVVLPPVRLRRM